jgi:hypothetical protein
VRHHLPGAEHQDVTARLSALRIYSVPELLLAVAKRPVAGSCPPCLVAAPPAPPPPCPQCPPLRACRFAEFTPCGDSAEATRNQLLHKVFLDLGAADGNSYATFVRDPRAEHSFKYPLPCGSTLLKQQ